MPCFYPLQANFSIKRDGKKKITFLNHDVFSKGVKPSLMLSCGRCIGCRLERSRQWAVRCLHESKLYDENCFITLTYDDESLFKYLVNGSLDRSHFQNFMKRLRKRFPEKRIRVFYCGEYGEKLQRPHFHACLFNFDFLDKVFFSRSSGEDIYFSQILSSIWDFGHHSIGSFSFESAGYVARYCTKKITGDLAKDHYQGKTPEFCGMSLKPGIGRGWIEKYGPSDVFPHDEVIVRGVRCKPPRYYDKVLESLNPARFKEIQQSRLERAMDHESDSTYQRLLTREKCVKARFNKLIRRIEGANYAS